MIAVLWWALPWLLLTAAAAVLAIFIVRFARKRRALKMRLASLRAPDNRQAIAGMFAYSMDLLGAMGLLYGGNSLYELWTDVESISGIPKEQFARAVSIYQEAVFSAHDMTDAQRKDTASLMESALDELKRRYTGLRRLKIRYVLNLY